MHWGASSRSQVPRRADSGCHRRSLGDPRACNDSPRHCGARRHGDRRARVYHVRCARCARLRDCSGRDSVFWRAARGPRCCRRARNYWGPGRCASIYRDRRRGYDRRACRSPWSRRSVLSREGQHSAAHGAQSCRTPPQRARERAHSVPSGGLRVRLQGRAWPRRERRPHSRADRGIDNCRSSSSAFGCTRACAVGTAADVHNAGRRESYRAFCACASTTDIVVHARAVN
eukprot:Amastigsp_a11383_16.p2 type:complete len:230 gc:universal Amastigsp_a11383_16:1345-656(-)